MKRRTFLLLTAAAVTAISVPLIYEKYKRNDVADPWITSSIMSQILDEQAIRQIGKEYRQEVPEENTKEKLMTLLQMGIQSTDKNKIREALEDKIQKDFQNEQVKVIYGWILSITELRQYALLSLT